MLVLDLPPENKLGNKPFHPKERFAVNFFGYIESIANLPGAENLFARHAYIQQFAGP